jgi:hypothetical protein
MGKDNGYGGKKDMKITSSRRLSVCRYCGRKIIWIQTKAGRNMPCDPELICYRIPEDGKGSERIVTVNGEVVSADRVYGREGNLLGYVPHFATCGKKR